MSPRRHHGLHVFPGRLVHLLVITPVALTAYMLLSGENGLFRVWRQADRIAQLEVEVAAIRVDNEAQTQRTLLLKTDLKTIERIARERYGMVKDNESVYMVYPSRPDARKSSETAWRSEGVDP